MNKMRKVKIIVTLLLLTPLLSLATENQPSKLEKIIIVRHAEKPENGLGQLTCQGLNRALQLPNYLLSHYPKPDYIFAPKPSIQVDEGKTTGNKLYDYIRPLITIEPTAIRLGMPVNVQIGYNEPEALVNALLQKKYHHSTIYVAWEHYYITRIADLLLKHFHNNTKIPDWSNSDYSMVFVMTIDWEHPNTLQFTVAKQNIQNPAKECPYEKSGASSNTSL